MAGGPIFPYSIAPITAGKVFPGLYDGGSNDKEWGIMVIASLDADATVRLAFQMPPSFPSGTGKLVLKSRANATTGVAKVNPKWVSIAPEEDPGTAVNAEGVQTVTWAGGDADVDKETKVTLDADTLVVAERVYMDLVFETASWTLAAESLWVPSIIWE